MTGVSSEIETQSVKYGGISIMKEYPLNVPVPHHFTFAVRDVPNVTVEQRERALKATHYNEFAFPSGMLTVDMLSDSGTTAMTNQQWASLFLGDEALSLIHI